MTPRLVALVCFAGYPDQGATYFYEMARALARSGIEVHAYAVRYPGQPFFACEDRVTVHRVVQIGANRWLDKAKFFARVLVELWRYRFPIVHVYTTLGAFVLPLLGPRKSRYLHELQSGAVSPGPNFIRRIDDILRRQQSRLFDLNATVSAELRDRMFGPEDSEVAIFPAGVNLSMFTGERNDSRRRERNLADDDIIFVYSGAFEVIRELDVVIRAAARVMIEESRLHLWMLGKGSSLESLRALADGLGVGDRVWLPGYIPYREVPSYLSSADAGISWLPDVPYYATGQPPMKVIEFLSAGLPVIASDLPSHAVLVTHNKTGLLCTPTEEGLADALRVFVRDSALRTTLRAGARKSIESYDWNTLAKEKIIPAYRELLTAQAKSAGKSRWFRRRRYNNEVWK